MNLPSLFALLLALSLPLTLRADLTIQEKVEGAGPVSNVTVKIKGDMARIEASPQVTSIINGKTGDMISLMNDQKVAVRMSAQKLKAATEMMKKYNARDSSQKSDNAVHKLQPTGKKDKIGGYDTEEYVQDSPDLKASFWIATNYPDAANILKQLQTLSSEFMKQTAKMPDYRDFPGFPLKTVFTVNGTQVTSTVVSVKTDSLDASQFTVPADYHEMQTPDLKDLMGGKGQEAGGEASPHQP
jgi:hypothetical protein